MCYTFLSQLYKDLSPQDLLFFFYFMVIRPRLHKIKPHFWENGPQKTADAIHLNKTQDLIKVFIIIFLLKT